MLDERLTQQQALDLLQHCLEDGEVILSDHALKELAKDGLDVTDAHYVLKKGAVFDPPERDVRTGKWRYRVEGTCPSEKWLAVIFTFDSTDVAIVVTSFVVSRSK